VSASASTWSADCVRKEGGGEGGEGGEGRGGEGWGGEEMNASAWTRHVRVEAASPRMLDCVRTDAPCPCGRWVASPRTYRGVRADTSILSPGNFITDATVRPSHGRPSGHHPTVRPSVRYGLCDNPGLWGWKILKLMYLQIVIVFCFKLICNCSIPWIVQLLCSLIWILPTHFQSKVHGMKLN
jgi:hypothetical protein